MTNKVITRGKELVNNAGTKLLSPPIGGRGHFVNHGPRDAKRIALTFDDGPSTPCTANLIDAMAELGVQGTFFCVGVNARWHPELMRRMDAGGHVIGNHSGWHSRKEGARLRSDSFHVRDGERAIVEAIGKRPALYRPPWGWLTPWEGRRVRTLGYTIVGWDVYTLDWKWPELDGALVADKACEEIQPGSIVLLHDANAGVENWEKTETVVAVKEIVSRMRDSGYEFVTVPQLLGIEGYHPDSEGILPTA